jgi:hypothetical protein
MHNIDQKTLVPLIHIAIILIGIDAITTVAGLKLGLEEHNFISIMFINVFGNFYGLILSMVGKCILIIFPMVAYQYVSLETTFLKNTYWVLYMVLIIVTIMATLRADINNIMDIVNKLQYNV